MSENSIPNLLSLRGPQRGGSLRSRGRRGARHYSGASSGDRNRDEIVQGTDTDAAISRLSAVSLGYLADPFASAFVANVNSTITARRLPIINRGTYTRTAAIDKLVTSFLEDSSSPKQIISLGAGTDTRALRLLASELMRSSLVYHELDFPAISRRKRQIVQTSTTVRNVLRNPTSTPLFSAGLGTSSDSANEEDEVDAWMCTPLKKNDAFCFTGIDLRRLPGKPPSVLPGLRTDLSTMLISECCLCYLEVSEATNVIQWFADKIPDLGIALYEAIRPDDAFGQIMVSNLAARGIYMPTLQKYKEVGDQKIRLSEAGFEKAKAKMIKDIWNDWVPIDEKGRVDGLEGLDEIEEWNLLAGHYVVAWGSKGEGFSGWDEIT